MNSVSQYESTVWSSLIVTLAAAAYFFGKVFGALAAGAPLEPSQVARLGLAIVVILVAVEIAFQLMVTAWCKSAPQVDERDRLIAAKATRNAYYVLVTGLFMLIGHLGLQSLFGRGPGLTLDTVTTVVLLVFVLVVAEIGQMASRIFYYRRGP
jgi:hypothetical protein